MFVFVCVFERVPVMVVVFAVVFAIVAVCLCVGLPCVLCLCRCV